MTRFLIILGSIAVALGAVAAGYFNMAATLEDDPTGMANMPGMASPVAGLDDPVAGKALYQENCAVCHGANLEGQPNWQTPADDGSLRAPPHDKSGHTWHHADQLLFSYTKLGGKAAMAKLDVEFNSGMPAFQDQLSDQQIRDILAYFKSTWPDRERQAQAQRTEAERLLEEDEK